MDIPFPIEQLRVKQSELRGVLGVRRHNGSRDPLTWSFSIEFEDVPYDGRDVRTNILFEELQLSMRDWRNLAGRVFSSKSKTGEFVSFYLLDHRVAEDWELRFGTSRGNLLDVVVRMRVDLNDAYDLANPPLTEVQIETPLEVTGVYVQMMPEFEPANQEAAAAVLAAQMDIELFRTPTLCWDLDGVKQYLFRPM